MKAFAVLNAVKFKLFIVKRSRWSSYFSSLRRSRVELFTNDETSEVNFGENSLRFILLSRETSSGMRHCINN